MDEGHLRKKMKHKHEDAAENLHEDHICYLYSSDYTEVCSKLPTDKGRSKMVHSLIKSYRMFKKMKLVAPTAADEDQLAEFHTEKYIKFLKGKKVHNSSDDSDEEEKEEFGLEDDCPWFEGAYEYVKMVGGASLDAAKILIDHCDQDGVDYNCNNDDTTNNNTTNNNNDDGSNHNNNNSNITTHNNNIQITTNDNNNNANEPSEHNSSNLKNNVTVIHWDGGRHHCRSDIASGFCYVNDIDIHHGDGVGEAFYYSDQVFTLSFHKYGPGFFPGTGSLDQVGAGKGKYYCCNVPLHDGIDDITYTDLFTTIVNEVKDRFDPLVVVMQCGADMLCRDPLGTFNLTPVGVGNCLSVVKAWNLPLLVLGGGGYNNADTARCWAYLTGLLLGLNLDDTIPEHDYFQCYGPDFRLLVPAGHRPNKNTKEYLHELIHQIKENLKNIHLPSVEK